MKMSCSTFGEQKLKFTVEDAVIKLRTFWSENFQSRGDIRNLQHNLIWERAEPNLKDLLFFRTGVMSNKKMMEKISILCTTLSGLGRPSSNLVMKETSIALQSVLKVEDITKLKELPTKAKELYVLELVQIVMGIRIFNKDCKKGGEGIEDLPEMLTLAVEKTRDRIAQEIEGSKKKIADLLTSLIEIYPVFSEGHFKKTQSTLQLEELRLMKEILFFYWVKYLNLREVKIEMIACELHVRSCITQLKETLIQLHDTVKYRVAIPSIQVYPLFMQLSLVWRELQVESAILSHFSKLLSSCQSFENLLPEYELPVVHTKASRRISADEICRTRSSVKENYKLNGFCPLTLVETDGMLLLGKVVKGDYSFHSEWAANQWADNSACYTQQLMKILSTRTELARFLNITPPLTAFPSQKKIESSSVEVGVQTEVHPVAGHIERDYVWSEWEMKRRAVQLAKLMQRRTKSQQTHVSAYHSDKCVQHRPIYSFGTST